MNWIIERDKEGTPLRIWWAKESQAEKELQARLDAADRHNELPMPAMREWAAKHGLTGFK